MKYCEDCKHRSNKGFCSRPIFNSIYKYVYKTPKPTPLDVFCSMERADRTGCGPDAIYYEPTLWIKIREKIFN